MRNNDYVWWNEEGWLYLGMDEDGITHLYRPMRLHPFKVLEFEQIGAEDLEDFMKENGDRNKSCVESKNVTDEMMKELGWEESDELKFDDTEVCEDYGEYKSLYIRNITAEERLKNE